MNTSQIEPYLAFNGNCEEAMNFYKSVLGGELEVSHFSDYAKPGEKSPEGVMHSSLKAGGLSFMASDGMPGKKVVFGDSVSMSIAGTDEPALTKIFNGLSKGGKVTIPLAKQMWGDVFGMFDDKFGIHWLVNIGKGDK